MVRILLVASWYCPDCRYSTTTKHDRQTKAKQFRQFLAYVTDTLPLRLQGQSLTTWDRDHAWCWSTRPIWQVTGEVYDQVFIDGTYIPTTGVFWWPTPAAG